MSGSITVSDNINALTTSGALLYFTALPPDLLLLQQNIQEFLDTYTQPPHNLSTSTLLYELSHACLSKECTVHLEAIFNFANRQEASLFSKEATELLELLGSGKIQNQTLFKTLLLKLAQVPHENTPNFLIYYQKMGVFLNVLFHYWKKYYEPVQTMLLAKAELAGIAPDIILDTLRKYWIPSELWDLIEVSRCLFYGKPRFPTSLPHFWQSLQQLIHSGFILIHEDSPLRLAALRYKNSPTEAPAPLVLSEKLPFKAPLTPDLFSFLKNAGNLTLNTYSMAYQKINFVSKLIFKEKDPDTLFTLALSQAIKDKQWESYLILLEAVATKLPAEWTESKIQALYEYYAGHEDSHKPAEILAILAKAHQINPNFILLAFNDGTVVRQINLIQDLTQSLDPLIAHLIRHRPTSGRHQGYQDLIDQLTESKTLLQSIKTIQKHLIKMPTEGSRYQALSSHLKLEAKTDLLILFQAAEFFLKISQPIPTVELSDDVWTDYLAISHQPSIQAARSSFKSTPMLSQAIRPNPHLHLTQLGFTNFYLKARPETQQSLLLSLIHTFCVEQNYPIQPLLLELGNACLITNSKQALLNLLIFTQRYATTKHSTDLADLIIALSRPDPEAGRDLTDHVDRMICLLDTLILYYRSHYQPIENSITARLELIPKTHPLHLHTRNILSKHYQLPAKLSDNLFSIPIDFEHSQSVRVDLQLLYERCSILIEAGWMKRFELPKIPVLRMTPFPSGWTLHIGMGLRLSSEADFENYIHSDSEAISLLKLDQALSFLQKDHDFIELSNPSEPLFCYNIALPSHLLPIQPQHLFLALVALSAMQKKQPLLLKWLFSSSIISTEDRHWLLAFWAEPSVNLLDPIELLVQLHYCQPELIPNLPILLIEKLNAICRYNNDQALQKVLIRLATQPAKKYKINFFPYLKHSADLQKNPPELAYEKIYFVIRLLSNDLTLRQDLLTQALQENNWNLAVILTHLCPNLPNSNDHWKKYRTFLTNYANYLLLGQAPPHFLIFLNLFQRQRYLSTSHFSDFSSFFRQILALVDHLNRQPSALNALQQSFKEKTPSSGRHHQYFELLNKIQRALSTAEAFVHICNSLSAFPQAHGVRDETLRAYFQGLGLIHGLNKKSCHFLILHLKMATLLFQHQTGAHYLEKSFQFFPTTSFLLFNSNPGTQGAAALLPQESHITKEI